MKGIKKMRGKVMLLSIFLVFLLVVSAVSAADDTSSDVVGYNNDFNETAMSADSISIDENSKVDDFLTQTNDGYLMDSAGSFEDLQREINNAPSGSVLSLTRDYNADKGGSWYGSIFIDKDLTIDGQGHTLDGLGKGTIIYSKSATTLLIKNLNFINGRDAVENTDAGAIQVGGAQCTI